MINVVIPMAGAGSRFSAAGFALPKPFIDVRGRMMIERVLDGLRCSNAHYTLIIQRAFEEQHADLLQRLAEHFPVAFLCVEKLTQGACCTALAAHRVIDNALPVLFADSDTIYRPDVISRFVDDCKARRLDGSLLTFPSQQICFSYAAVDEQGQVTATREKEPISSHAISGAYLFACGGNFVHCALQPLIYGTREKGEFYMSSVFNCAARLGLRIGIHDITENDFDCLGTPEQLKEYLKRN